jgi:hypothetical protein
MWDSIGLFQRSGGTNVSIIYFVALCSNNIIGKYAVAGRIRTHKRRHVSQDFIFIRHNLEYTTPLICEFDGIETKITTAPAESEARQNVCFDLLGSNNFFENSHYIQLIQN